MLDVATSATDVDRFLGDTSMTLEEGYAFIVSRSSDCRMDGSGYYPQYFYDKKIPLMQSELRIDQRRPTSKKRFIAKSKDSAKSEPEEDGDKENSSRYSSNMLREWNFSPPLKPKKMRIKKDSRAISTLSGYLQKKTVTYGGYSTRWEKRYVVLSDESLKYTKHTNPQSKDAKWRVYPFTSGTDQACRIARDGVTLIIDVGIMSGYPRILELKSDTESDARKWCEKLNAAARSHY